MPCFCHHIERELVPGCGGKWLARTSWQVKIRAEIADVHEAQALVFVRFGEYSRDQQVPRQLYQLDAH